MAQLAAMRRCSGQDGPLSAGSYASSKELVLKLKRKKPIGIRLDGLSLSEGNERSYTSCLLVIKLPQSQGTIEIVRQTGSPGKAW